MNKYEESYKIASNLAPRDLLNKKVREAVDLVKEACDKAKKYDEKETPKQPKSKRFYYNCHNGECDKTFIHYCPICNFSSVEKNYANYCPNCGQKLDWSDEDDK